MAARSSLGRVDCVNNGPFYPSRPLRSMICRHRPPLYPPRGLPSVTTRFLSGLCYQLASDRNYLTVGAQYLRMIPR